ncbi:MAG: aspartate kinase [Flavobacteriaceae bacterium]|nr:aspartate kinase [Flavobacteriaceae bacterium]
MKVFKFGGASVKDAEGVKNVANLLQKVGYDDVLIVISAMGKMTNAFEKIVEAYHQKKKELPLYINEVRNFHYTIIDQLFSKGHKVYDDVEMLFMSMTGFMIKNKSTDFDYVYDQIVSYAELISTKIVSHYLTEQNIKNNWIDVRDFIITDSFYREGKVNWVKTERNITEKILPNNLYITQGFIAKDAHGNTTTLGREGSDYSAAIFTYLLDAENLTIWKDVPGVLNADPRYFKESQLLHRMSYAEAIELAFYGASVIHPKTLQPLQRKKIPLLVKSFLRPEETGTIIIDNALIEPYVPCFIVKKEQILLSISSLDFSFIVEQNISEIFGLLHQYKMKVNLIQNSAISFSVCIEDKYLKINALLSELKTKFGVEMFENATLFTIRHFNDKAIETIEKHNKVLLKQMAKETVQIVIQ